MKKSEMDEASVDSYRWTPEQVKDLHEMVVEYGHAKFLKRKAIKWLVWVFALPGTVLMVWEPLVRLWKLFGKG